MSEAIRERSSCGARVTSRTRPLAAPDGSYTVAPNNSLKARVSIPLENNQLAWDSERKSRSGRQASALGRPEMHYARLPHCNILYKGLACLRSEVQRRKPLYIMNPCA